jgi:hypothetical protein
MNENDARSAVRRSFERTHIAPAFGFEGRMQTALLRAAPAPVVTERRRLREGLAILAALVAAVAVVSALVGPRLLTRVPQPAVVASPSPLAPSPSPNANGCRLPVVVYLVAGVSLRNTAGFVDVATGKFSPATDVSFADLAPATRGTTIPTTGAVYDPVLMRWLPSTVLSPDLLSYVYVTVKGGASTLHTFDVVHHTDRALWTIKAVRATPTRWKADGIYAFTDDLSGGTAPPRYWRVDPQSGKATEINRLTDNPYLSLLTGVGQWGTSGFDPERMIYMIGGIDSKHTYFVIINHKRTDIYSGPANDRKASDPFKDFDPFNVVYDGSVLWFSNVDSKYVWSWTAATGLTPHLVKIPGAPFTDKRDSGYLVAGPCV